MNVEGLGQKFPAAPLSAFKQLFPVSVKMLGIDLGLGVLKFILFFGFFPGFLFFGGFFGVEFFFEIVQEAKIVGVFFIEFFLIGVFF